MSAQSFSCIISLKALKVSLYNYHNDLILSSFFVVVLFFKYSKTSEKVTKTKQLISYPVLSYASCANLVPYEPGEERYLCCWLAGEIISLRYLL